MVQATGRIARDARGLELLLERSIPVDAATVRAWLTKASHRKTWLGAPASVVEREESRIVIDDLTTLSLVEADGATVVFLRERLPGWREAGERGPLWEFRLDRLVAGIAGGEAPRESDYVPTQRPYYERLAMDGDPVAWPPS